MEKNDILGLWKLKAFEIEKPDGQISDWRPNAHGTLFYDQSGHMSVSINADSLDSSDSSDGILFYSGTFKLKNDTTIDHYVVNASKPERIGKTMIRDISLRNEDLYIVGRGDFGEARLIWTRK